MVILNSYREVAPDLNRLNNSRLNDMARAEITVIEFVFRVARVHSHAENNVGLFFSQFYSMR